MRDPAFLFYDGDAARDVSHMNRLERGCYFDLIQAQRKFHGITMEQAKKILGKDFDSCWPALEMILSNIEGVYFIQWVRDSSEKRAQSSEIQRKRIQDYWDKIKKSGITTEIPRNNDGISVVIPIENEIEIKIDKERYGEKKEEYLCPSEAEILYDEIIGFFSEDLRPKNDKQKFEWINTLEKLIRIDLNTPESIKRVIEDTRKDSFWKSNFLSVLKLRRKDKDDNMYFTVFKNRINGSHRSGDERQIERVNKLWDQKN